MTEEKILDRVRKLLELAKSDNVNEAGNAAKQAQLLMTRHSITEAMVDVDQDDDEVMEAIETGLLHRDGSKLATWKGRLGVAIAAVNQCKCYRTGPTLRIIGRPSDANTVRYLFSYVAKEIDRLCEQEASLRGNPGKTWRNNFRLGAVYEVDRRLTEAAKEARAAMKQEAQDGDTMGTGVALVRINNALAKLDERTAAVEDYGKRRLKLRAGGASHSRFDGDGRAAGKRAGSRIDLGGGGRASLGSGNRRKLGS